ncbi:methylosome subunit pICln [Nephila pilipes]|uniref:Methylosome subunit pICln n=1 Tax=Nephila pilipes TaxID=299642 RepID=A0A8X6MTR8_NEPPI|nr:methylosome subunit pICln [Nephila pilipes]
MVLLRNFPVPTEGVNHVQPNTRAFFKSECLGKGTLYASKSILCWLSSSGEGFSLLYSSIAMHAISFDHRAFPEPCILMMITERIMQKEDPNELSSALNSMSVSRGVDKKVELHQLCFVPDDLKMLDTMFDAIRACSTLNPVLEIEEMEEENGDVFSSIDIQFGNVDSDPEFAEENDDFEEDDGQFEDAES